MSIIKLHSIDSTNNFLKDLSRKEVVENYTVVVAKNQTNGKGQMGSVWETEAGKNLIMSVLIKDVIANIDAIFHLNIAIALSVFNVIKEYNLPKVSIKWANDILSDNKKIGGILIENNFKSDGKIESIVGIGLNVNQKSFENLPKASSMSSIMQKEFDVEKIMNEILLQIQHNCNLITLNKQEQLWNNYHSNLYKINNPMPFEDTSNTKFMGIIQGVSQDGKLKILLENDEIKLFSIKEVVMLY